MHASRMATADIFADILASLTEERANATRIVHWLAGAATAERRVWAVEALQVQASVEVLWAANGCVRSIEHLLY